MSYQEKKIVSCLSAIALCQVLCLVLPVKSQFLSTLRLRSANSNKAKQLLLKEIMDLELSNKRIDFRLDQEPLASQRTSEITNEKILASNEEVGARPDVNRAGCGHNSIYGVGTCWTKNQRIPTNPSRFGLGRNANRMNKNQMNNLMDVLGVSPNRSISKTSHDATEYRPELLRMLLNLELLIDNLKTHKRVRRTPKRLTASRSVAFAPDEIRSLKRQPTIDINTQRLFKLF